MYNLLNIKRIAEDKKISIKYLTEKIGITEQGFYKSLKNNSMNIKTVADIAKLLNVSISELVGETIGVKMVNKSLVSSPIEMYAPPEEKEALKQIMLEQQIEIAGLLKDKIYWMEKAHSLEIELERVKNAYAPGKDAIAG